MALYTIGDLHLSFGTDKPMDVFGGGWTNYTEKLTNGFKTLNDDDVCVICGDISWAMSLRESFDDFNFINSLPGKKIILKGNHDYWWNTAAKMKAFFASNNFKTIEILHNNCFYYEDIAICGTRGWMNDDTLPADKNLKIAAREVIRLRTSLQAAADIWRSKTNTKSTPQIFCFFHYPPRFANTICDEIISVMEEFMVKRCFYGHIHGFGQRFAAAGIIDGIKYDIISADYLDFRPMKIK